MLLKHLVVFLTLSVRATQIMTTESSSRRDRILGTWSLQSYYHFPISDPSNKTYPHGPNARGIIVYTPDGYMSAQVVRTGQPPFSDGAGIFPDTSGTPQDWEALGRNFIAYSGRFWSGESEGKECVWHEMSVVNLPSFVGKVQKRVVGMEEKDGEVYLHLGVEEVEIEGVKRAIKVVWKKMASNVRTLPPV